MAFVSSLAYAFLSAASCIDPLWVERVTQTWLMSPYWLWLLWQLLIRDWLGTVAICWGGWKETVCLHLVELSSKPTHSSVKRLLYLTLKVSWNNTEKIEDVLYYYKGSPAVDLLKQRGDLSWSRAPHHCSDTWFLQRAHHSSIMYDYKAIPQRLLFNGLLCRDENDMRTEKQKMERPGGFICREVA